MNHFQIAGVTYETDNLPIISAVHSITQPDEYNSNMIQSFNVQCMPSISPTHSYHSAVSQQQPGLSQYPPYNHSAVAQQQPVIPLVSQPSPYNHSAVAQQQPGLPQHPPYNHSAVAQQQPGLPLVSQLPSHLNIYTPMQQYHRLSSHHAASRQLEELENIWQKNEAMLYQQEIHRQYILRQQQRQMQLIAEHEFKARLARNCSKYESNIDKFAHVRTNPSKSNPNVNKRECPESFTKGEYLADLSDSHKEYLLKVSNCSTFHDDKPINTTTSSKRENDGVKILNQISSSLDDIVPTSKSSAYPSFNVNLRNEVNPKEHDLSNATGGLKTNDDVTKQNTKKNINKFNKEISDKSLANDKKLAGPLTQQIHQFMASVISSVSKAEPFVIKSAIKTEPFVVKSEIKNEPFVEKSAIKNEPFVMKSAIEDEPFAMKSSIKKEPFVMKSATVIEPSIIKPTTKTETIAMKSTNNTEPFVMKSATKTRRIVMENATNTEPIVIKSLPNTEPFVKNSSTNTKPFVIKSSIITEPLIMKSANKIESLVKKSATNTEPLVTKFSNNTELIATKSSICLFPENSKNKPTSPNIKAYSRKHIPSAAKCSIKCDTKTIVSDKKDLECLTVVKKDLTFPSGLPITILDTISTSTSTTNSSPHDKIKNVKSRKESRKSELKPFTSPCGVTRNVPLKSKVEKVQFLIKHNPDQIQNMAISKHNNKQSRLIIKEIINNADDNSFVQDKLTSDTQSCANKTKAIVTAAESVKRGRANIANESKQNVVETSSNKTKPKQTVNSIDNLDKRKRTVINELKKSDGRTSSNKCKPILIVANTIYKLGKRKRTVIVKEHKKNDGENSTDKSKPTVAVDNINNKIDKQKRTVIIKESKKNDGENSTDKTKPTVAVDNSNDKKSKKSGGDKTQPILIVDNIMDNVGKWKQTKKINVETSSGKTKPTLTVYNNNSKRKKTDIIKEPKKSDSETLSDKTKPTLPVVNNNDKLGDEFNRNFFTLFHSIFPE